MDRKLDGIKVDISVLKLGQDDILLKLDRKVDKAIPVPSK
jgi:hypothetical protein